MKTKYFFPVILLILAWAFCANAQIGTCTADFAADITKGCAPLKVTFTSKSLGATSYQWKFPGGSPATATGKGPHVVSYSTAGAYDVGLKIVCSQNVTDEELKKGYIVVTDCSCQADFEGKPRSGCSPLKVVFTDLSKNAAKWTWNFPGGVPSTATGKGPHTVLYGSPGKYDVELDILCKDGSDLEKKTRYIVTNDCDVRADFSADPKEGCSPLQVTFRDQSSNATEWLWSFPGGEPSSGKGQGPHEVTYSDSGHFDVKLIVANQVARDTLFKNDEIIVFPCFYDYGDAPETGLAYPSLGVTGKFPTCRYIGPAGYIRHGKNKNCFFGYKVDHEQEGNAGGCFDAVKGHWDQDELCGASDAGLWKPNPYTLTGDPGMETVAPLCASLPGTPMGFACAMAAWGRNIDIWWQCNLDKGAYINVIMDWNQDGDWGDSSWCEVDHWIPEHVLVNFPVPGGWNGLLSNWHPPSFRMGSNSGYVWARFTISERPVALPWNGSGSFDDGESEDYLLKVKERIRMVDFGDAPAPYPTTMAVGGAYQLISDGIYIGSGVDGEDDGQPDTLALGDDQTGNSKEDGIQFSDLAPGDTSCVQIMTSVPGFIKIWIDFNRDGDWADPGELAVDQQAGQGANRFCLKAPDDANPGVTYARCRFSDSAIAAYDGEGGIGEIDDIRIVVGEYIRPPILSEFGDAPEGALAYPAGTCEGVAAAVMGNFPTCKNFEYGEYPIRTNAGFIQHTKNGKRYLGSSVDFETDGCVGSCPGSSDDDALYDDGGLRNMNTYKIVDDRIVSNGGSSWENLIVCGTGVWGRTIDVLYHVNDEDGAYINAVIDWDHNGEWRPGSLIRYCDDEVAANEHILRDFFVPQGSGSLGDLHPPDFRIGASAGYAWLRVTISDEPLDPATVVRGSFQEGWNGAGFFRDGETEDYLVYISGAGYREYGDAPEGSIAYPSTGVIGHFPTCRYYDAAAGTGYISHGSDLGQSFMFLGCSLCTPSYEPDGNRGSCPGLANADDDNGLFWLLPYTFRGTPAAPEIVAEFDSSWFGRYRLGSTCSLARWGEGENLDVYWTNQWGDRHPYVNVLIDWNQDGEWGGSVTCEDGHVAQEHVLVNFELPFAMAGSGLCARPGGGPPDFRIGPNAGYVWARFTITPVPVTLPWNGSGSFDDGETEDYLLYISRSWPDCDYGDVPWAGLASSARHSYCRGFFLGDTVDTEPEFVYDPNAEGDDRSGVNDDDGVHFPTPLKPGEPATIVVKASADGLLNAWFDFNGNSNWKEKNEHVFKDVQLKKGQSTLIFVVPDSGVAEKIFARFRFSDQAGLSYADPVGDPQKGWTPPNGEVEDYLVQVIVTDVNRNALPVAFNLEQNHPNPFNPITQIRYSVPRTVQVHLAIYNIQGQLVRTLVEERRTAGSYSVVWDGRDDQGQLLSSGLYMYRIDCPGFTKTRKLLFLK